MATVITKFTHQPNRRKRTADTVIDTYRISFKTTRKEPADVRNDLVVALAPQVRMLKAVYDAPRATVRLGTIGDSSGFIFIDWGGDLPDDVE